MNKYISAVASVPFFLTPLSAPTPHLATQHTQQSSVYETYEDQTLALDTPLGTTALRAYAQETTSSDGGEKVSVTYPIEARLFGVFASSISVQAEVTHDGAVAIRYPWYSFLYGADTAQIQVNLVLVGEEAKAFNTETFTADQEKALLALLEGALRDTSSEETHTSVTL